MEEMSFKDYSIFCPGGHLVQQSGTIWVIQQLFLESFIKIGQAVTEEMPFNSFFSIFSPDGHLVQRTGTISEILVGGHPMIIPVKFYQNQPSGSGTEVV